MTFMDLWLGFMSIIGVTWGGYVTNKVNQHDISIAVQDTKLDSILEKVEEIRIEMKAGRRE